MAYGAAGTVITGSPPACRAFNSASQNHTVTGGWQMLTLDSNRFDPTSMHSTVTNTSRITFTSPGVYMLSGGLEFASNATGFRGIGVRLNGATFIAVHFTVAGSTAMDMAISTLYKFAANDYVELGGWQSSGGTLAVASIGNYTPEFAAMWVGLGT